MNGPLYQDGCIPSLGLTSAIIQSEITISDQLFQVQLAVSFVASMHLCSNQTHMMAAGLGLSDNIAKWKHILIINAIYKALYDVHRFV